MDSDFARELEVEQLDVYGVTLLSVDEAESMPEDLRTCSGCWWLRSQGACYEYAALVYGIDGNIDYQGDDVYEEYGVRPALLISNLKSLKLGPRYMFKVNDIPYVVISDNMAITKDIVDDHVFNSNDSKGNRYHESDIKQFVEDWSKEQGFAKSVMYNKIKLKYEATGCLVYKRAMDVFESEEFDYDTASNELEAADRIFKKLSKTGKIRKFIEVIPFDDADDDFQKDFGD